jgi:RNA polymerase-binding protein DksA
MDTQTEQRLRTELETSRRDAVKELRDLGAEPGSNQVRELTGVDDNFADSASATTERAEKLALIGQTRERLTDIEHALERIDEGTYGTCEHCGGPIAEARLEARPMSVLCVGCAAGAA